MRGRRVAIGFAAALVAVVAVPATAVARPAAVPSVSRFTTAHTVAARAAGRDRSESARHGISTRSLHVTRGMRGRSSTPVPAVLRGAVTGGGLRAHSWSPGVEPAPRRPAISASSARGPPAVV